MKLQRLKKDISPESKTILFVNLVIQKIHVWNPRLGFIHAKASEIRYGEIGGRVKIGLDIN